MFTLPFENGDFNVGRNLESYSLVLSRGYVAATLQPVLVCLYAGLRLDTDDAFYERSLVSRPFMREVGDCGILKSKQVRTFRSYTSYGVVIEFSPSPTVLCGDSCPQFPYFGRLETLFLRLVVTIVPALYLLQHLRL
jgi:hypothetical protein